MDEGYHVWAGIHQSVQFKVSLNTASIIYQFVKLLHVSILHPYHLQACINCTKVYFVMYTGLQDLLILMDFVKFRKLTG
jgi:hypothetical protein